MPKRVAIYLSTNIADDPRTTADQLQQLQEIAQRLGWDVVATYTDVGQRAKSRSKRPSFDRLLAGAKRGEFDLIAAWSSSQLGRSLQELLRSLATIKTLGVDLYLVEDALDTSTPSGRSMLQLVGVFEHFNDSLISARIREGLCRTPKRLGRPPLPGGRVEGVKRLLQAGCGTREAARKTGVGAASVQRIKNTLAKAGAPSAA